MSFFRSDASGLETGAIGMLPWTRCATSAAAGAAVTQLARAGVCIKSNVLGRCARASQTFPARVRGGNKTRARSHSGNRSRQRRSLRYQPASAIARPYRRTMMTQFGPPECLVELRTWGRRFAIRSPNLLFGLVSTPETTDEEATTTAMPLMTAGHENDSRPEKVFRSHVPPQ